MVNLLNSPKPSIVFFGNERLATGVTTKVPVLRALIEAGYPIEAVIVNHEQAKTRKERQLEIAHVAAEHNIPVLTKFSPELTSTVAVLVAYGRIVPKSIIGHFEHGILNVHPSALPKYRGSTPLESVMLDGLDATAVSLMKLDVKMDAGAVYAQNDLVLPQTISKQELADAAGELGAQMVVEALPEILDGSLSATPQDESQATFTKQITKQDGQIDWSKSALQVEREIRAFAGWPGSSADINNQSVIITQGEVISESGVAGSFFIVDKQLAVYCHHDALLIKQLKPAGKREMDSRDYLRGNPI